MTDQTEAHAAVQLPTEGAIRYQSPVTISEGMKLAFQLDARNADGWRVDYLLPTGVPARRTFAAPIDALGFAEDLALASPPVESTLMPLFRLREPLHPEHLVTAGRIQAGCAAAFGAGWDAEPGQREAREAAVEKILRAALQTASIDAHECPNCKDVPLPNAIGMTNLSVMTGQPERYLLLVNGERWRGTRGRGWVREGNAMDEDADMVWAADDPRVVVESVQELVQERASAGARPGAILDIRRARTLPPLTVRITSLDEAGQASFELVRDPVLPPVRVVGSSAQTRAADRAFEDYEFGDGVVVESADG